jgi:hypothetical protein
MKLSIVPIYIAFVFIFCIAITRRARSNQSIKAAEARSVYLLLLAFFVWTLIASVLGIREKHVEFMAHIPLLWQAFVVIVLWSTAFMFSSTLRNGLRAVATNTPEHWLVFIQALRIGALGGIMKVMRGEVTSGFVFWVGIPDFLFGVSALVVGWLLMRKVVGPRFLIAWNLVGFAVIILPTFVPMNYWMNEPGFSFIFEFPMVLSPSIIVPTLVSLNLLQAWGIFVTENKKQRVAEH